MRLEFREALRGFLGPGESPAEGQDRGRGGGSPFGFRATATIEDLDAFEADPEHRVRLEGEVDWAPLGGKRPLSDGELRLFVPREGGRALVYRLAFEAGRRRFELRGQKRLRRRPSFGDLTTLYVDLFEGGDEAPVARGILRVPLGEALRFGFQLRVPGKGWLASLSPALRFLRFSRRQLLAPPPAG